MKRLMNMKLTFWRVAAALILATGAVAMVLRFARGLGGSTHLSDQFPWGLWIGFDILCGVGLAAGGFTLAAIVHIFHVKRFEPIVRPTILTAFLGYLLVIVGLMFDLGRPWAIWHAIVMWNPHSVMFEVAWCVMLYTTVLSLEFAPVVLERFGWAGPLKVLRTVSVPIIIVGVLLSTLHQSSLGSLYLIVPEKLYPLWYTPYLPAMFFVSAIAAGCAMVIFESFLSARAFKRGLELPLLADVGKISVVALAVYATMRLVDLLSRGVLGLVLVPRTETYLWWAEIGLGVLLPMVLLRFRRMRENPRALFFGAVCVILGFVLNRMNVSITGMEASAGVRYFPSWIEIMVTVSIVTAGFIVFGAAARHLPVFVHAEPEPELIGRERVTDALRLATRVG
jgi:Ni/Fe-hydrogenase subunit HybB-like protein